MRKIIVVIIITMELLGANQALAAATSSPRLIEQAVPFSSQAPTFDWGNPRFQGACEETSVLMAMRWVKGGSFGVEATSTKKMAQDILSISNYESKNFSTYDDTSVADTASWLLSSYFKYNKYEIKKNLTIKMLIQALERGNIIIVPTNGRLLKNLHFTGAGPEHHMVLIKGYDYVNKSFITNDSGTRVGKDYKYPQNILFKAIADYPTGVNLPRKSIEKTGIIIRT